MSKEATAGLLACPFCGGEASIREDDGTFAAVCDNHHCFCCLGEGYDASAMPDHCFDSEDEAIDAWNCRASAPNLAAEVRSLRDGATKSNDDICQALGKALGYPWFKDDQKNFPDAIEANGICVGDHVAESMADEAARRMTDLAAENRKLREALEEVERIRTGIFYWMIRNHASSKHSYARLGEVKEALTSLIARAALGAGESISPSDPNP